MKNIIQSLFLVSLFFVMGTSTILYGRASGVAGTTLKDGGSGCSCHSGSPNAATTVTIAGPTTLMVGQTASYTVTVLRSGTFNTGVDIAALAGTLAPADGILKVNGSDLTHSANHSATTSYVYNFKYTAGAIGTDTLYATGCGSSSSTPDWNFAPNFAVTIVADTLPVSLALTSPIGGEVWDGNVSKNITWNSHKVANLKIEFTTDDGSTWTTIADAASAASGVYTWLVPNSTSALCRIKLTDAVNTLTSMSTSTFTINRSSFSSTLLLEENFIPPTDTSKILAGTNGWAYVAGTMTGTPLGYTNDNLSFGKYPSSSGQAVLLSLTSTSKAFKNVLVPAGNSVVYLSYLIKVPTAAQTLSNHIVGFGSGDMTTVATYQVKTYCKWNATTLAYNIGLGGSSSTYGTTSLAAGSVGLVVVKYDIAGNTADLYVFTDTSAYPTTLPSTSEVHIVPTAFTPSCIYLRSQTTLTLNCVIDGIRVMTAWGDVATDIKSGQNDMKALNCELKQNYPNPFNPSTNISYNLSSAGHVSLTVMNTLGEEVARLVDGVQSAGTHQVNFNASRLTSGVYLYRLTSGNYTVTRKMMLVK